MLPGWRETSSACALPVLQRSREAAPEIGPREQCVPGKVWECEGDSGAQETILTIQSTTIQIRSTTACHRRRKSKPRLCSKRSTCFVSVGGPRHGDSTSVG